MCICGSFYFGLFANWFLFWIKWKLRSKYISQNQYRTTMNGDGVDVAGDVHVWPITHTHEVYVRHHRMGHRGNHDRDVPFQ